MSSMHTETGVAPASPGQRSLWLMERYRGGLGLMSVPLLLRLSGPLDTAALDTALRMVLVHHESLRTTIEMRQGSLVQVIHPGPSAYEGIERQPGQAGSWAELHGHVRRMLQDEPDPRACPVRAALWKLGEQDHVLALNVHHLVTDAWSNRLIFSALGSAYSALLASRPVTLPAVHVRYADYARDVAHDQRSGGAEQEFWAQTLRDASFPRLPGPPRQRRTVMFRTRGPRPPAGHHPVELGPEMLARLRQTGRELRMTMFMMLLGAFMSSLATVTGQEDLAVGSIVANRSQPRLHQTVGLFANLTVLRARVCSSPLATAAELRRPVLAALSHQQSDYGSLPLGSRAEVAHGGPGDVVFQMLAQPPGTAGPGPLFAGLGVEELTWPDGLACRFDLELVLAPRDRRVTGLFRYATDRLTESWVRDLADHFTAALVVTR